MAGIPRVAGEGWAMGFSPEFRALVEEKLSEAIPIRTKSMFGGVGIYSGDLFFALIAEDKLYLKVDDLNQPDFAARGMEPFYPYDSPTPMRYWELPRGILEDPEELRVWVDKALGVAERASRKKRRR